MRHGAGEPAVACVADARSSVVACPVAAAVRVTRAGDAFGDVRRAEAAAPAPAPATGKGVSADGRKALEACWALEFPALADPNPFRTRLSQEICEEIGCPDYHEKCPNVADLALCKEKLEKYADDESLKKDI